MWQEDTRREDARPYPTDKQKPQMKAELKPLEVTSEKTDFKSRPYYIKVVLAGIFFLSLCANVGSLASSLVSKETCVTGEALLKEGKEAAVLVGSCRPSSSESCNNGLCYRGGGVGAWAPALALDRWGRSGQGLMFRASKVTGILYGHSKVGFTKRLASGFGSVSRVNNIV